MRRRSLVPLVILLSCAASLSARPAPENAGTLFTRLYAAYAAGDRWSPSLREDAIALLMDRPIPLGQDAGADAFELAWQLTFGILDEQRTLGAPSSLAKFGPSAIEHFDKAAGAATTRPEALVRKAAVLVRLSRAKEALDTLEGLKADDQTLRYWAALVRGHACESLGRPDEAVRAYTGALEIVPHAQSPAVALTSLDMRRGRAAEAERWASAGWAPGNAVDPWWQYDAGEYRFFRARLAELRGFIKP